MAFILITMKPVKVDVCIVLNKKLSKCCTNIVSANVKIQFTKQQCNILGACRLKRWIFGFLSVVETYTSN